MHSAVSLAPQLVLACSFLHQLLVAPWVDLPSVSPPPVSLPLLADHFCLPPVPFLFLLFLLLSSGHLFANGLLFLFSGAFWPVSRGRVRRYLKISVYKKASKNIDSCEGCSCSVVNPEHSPSKAVISKVTESQRTTSLWSFAPMWIATSSFCDCTLYFLNWTPRPISTFSSPGWTLSPRRHLRNAPRCFLNDSHWLTRTHFLSSAHK